MQTKKAFTIIEAVLTLGLLGAVAVIVLPISFRQLQSSQVGAVAKDITSRIFVTQQNAYSQRNFQDYGIAFFADRYVMFIGSSLITSTDTDEVILPANISINSISFSGGGNEILFVAGELLPQQNGFISVSDGYDSYTVTINTQGAILYDKTS